MIKAVFFDLDNTLIDFWKMKTKSIEAAIEAMIDAGLNVKKKTAKEMMYSLYDKYGYEYHFIFEKFLAKVLGKIDWRIMANGILAYRKVWLYYLQPYPALIETLFKLKAKGIKLAIVTDAPRLKAWIRLEGMRIGALFDAVICFEDTKKTKPHSLPFQTALKQLGLRAEDVLHVGDNPERDVAGARRMGMKAGFAKYGYIAKVGRVLVKPDFELRKFEDVLDIVEKA